jgi:hypothetical protein
LGPLPAHLSRFDQTITPAGIASPLYSPRLGASGRFQAGAEAARRGPI